MKTILNDLILLLNVYNVGDLIYRKEIIINGRQTVDNYRNYLTKAGYLKWEGPGKYRIVKKIPLDLGYNQLVSEAYPDSEWTKKYKDRYRSSKYKVCTTRGGFLALYHRALAKHRKDLCIHPFHGGTWLYSDKDPGSGRENVVVATNDPELLKEYPHLAENIMENEILDDYITFYINRK